MKIQGTLHKKYDTEQKTPTFKVREFVVKYEENPLYPQFVKFQVKQDRCDTLDQIAEGTMLEIDFDIRGREWTSPDGQVKYFNSLEAWRVTPVQATQAQQGDVAGSEPLPVPPPEAMDITQMEDDDLPF
ncbi:MAG: DUF3127 domain-containing protein [Bacteroidetes bacterium]|nr:MAG: DUF3127 domain-containing protein [Bacteroidota bacterium]